MKQIATNQKTGEIIVSNTGNLDEVSFQRTVSGIAGPEDKIVMRSDVGTRQVSFPMPTKPSDGEKSVVWRGSFCFLPDAKVLTIGGIKRIEDVNAGDMVFTHLGHTKAVVRKYQRDWDGEMIVIRNMLDGEELVLTPGHNLFCVKGTACLLRDSQTCKPTCHAQSNFVITPAGTKSFRCIRKPYQKYVMEKIHAGELTTRDFLFLPKLTMGVENQEVDVSHYMKGQGHKQWSTDGEWIWPSRRLNFTNKATMARNSGIKERWLGKGRLSPKKKEMVRKIVSEAASNKPVFDPRSLVNRIPCKHKLTYDFGRFLGLYAAEGSGQYMASFAFHEDELDLHEFTMRFIREEFKSDVSIARQPKKHSTCINACGAMLARVLQEWCGHGSHSKKIPDFIYSANDDVITGFINGLWDGDGNKKPRIKDNSLEYGTSSASLAYGLRLLLSRFDVTSSISIEKREKRVGYVLRISGEQLYENEWLKKFKYNRPRVPTTTKSKQNYRTDDGSFVQITSVSKRNYQGPVFDLEVEDDHSYLVNGKAVKNSDAGGYANMNREICLRLIHHGVNVRTDILRTAIQIDPLTMGLLKAMEGNRIQNEAACPLVIGFTPMPVQGKGRRVVFFTMMESSNKIHPEFVNRCNQGATEVWVPCQFYADVFRESGICKPIKVIPLGVNQLIYKPGLPAPILPYDEMPSGAKVLAPGRKHKFMSVFGWSHRKGPDVLCRSFIREFSAKDDACLVIYSRYVGSSLEPHKEFVRNEIRSYYEMEKKEDAPPIYYCGECVPIRQMPSIYSSADCFVFCSRGEGFALPVIEAAACGIPVISAYNTAMTDYLDDDVSWTVPPESVAPADDKLAWISEYYRGQEFAVYGDESINRFGQFMRTEMEDAELSRRKASAFRDKVLKDYTWDRCAEMVASELFQGA
jgi:glycosyltransferase involved in cell wall biosynthesis